MHSRHIDFPPGLDDTDGTQDPHVLYLRKRTGWLQLPAQLRFDAAHLLLPAVGQQQVNRSARHRTRQRIAHKRGSVHEHTRLARRNPLCHFRIGEHCRERHISSGQCLADAHNVRLHLGVFPRKELSGAPESGGYLVEEQQHAVLTAQLSGFAQVLRMIETHPARSLHNRFEYQSSQFFVMLFHNGAQRKDITLVPFASESAFGSRSKPAYGQCGTEQAVHTRHGVAHRHRIPRISVIARTDGNEIGLFGMSCRILVLHCHFQRHLDRHRTAIGIKDMPHRGRSYPQQPFAQSYGWLVRQSAEHHVRHIFQLVFYRPIQFGTIVTMHGTPPRRHSVYQFRTVRQRNHASFRPLHLVGRQRFDRRSIRMPQMFAVEIIGKQFNIHSLLLLSVLHLLSLSTPVW